MNKIEIDSNNQNVDLAINSITDSFVKKYGRYSNLNSHDEELDKLGSEMVNRLSPERRLLTSSNNY